MFVDTHAHIYLKDFNDDLSEILAEANENGVEAILMPNIDDSTIESLHTTESNYSQCHAMMGLHPCNVKDDYKDKLAIIKQQLLDRPYIAVGEVGVDLYWDKSTAEIQQEAFDYQIELALDLDLPVIIHSRDSLDITIQTIEKYQNGNLKGIFHCFNGTVEQGKRIQDVGFFMGIGGVVTFKNAGVDKTVSELSLDHMVLETDSPYLTPTPHRGTRNVPTYIPIIAQKLADVFQKSINEIAEKTTANASSLFQIEHYATKYSELV